MNPVLGHVREEAPDAAADYAMVRHSVSDDLAGLSVAGGGLLMLGGCMIALRRSRQRQLPLPSPAYGRAWL